MLEELTPPNTHRAFRAMHELRPHLASVEAFVDQVDRVQRPSGYRVVAAFDTDDEHAVAAAGFHVNTCLSWGRHLYVDDLTTCADARGRGWATCLLHWIHHEAVRLGCGQVHLDSGVGPERADAHRLYLNARYQITAHHFTRQATRGGADPDVG